MDESHYASHFYFRQDSVTMTDEEIALLADFDEFAYGADEVKDSLKKGSGKLMRAGSRGYGAVRNWINVYGPGLICMLAAADASSLVTSAELGKEWGYAMVIWQILLIYPLYVVQELTVRLGAATKLGHAQLIRYKYGACAAWGCAFIVCITCIASVVAQLTAIVGICRAVGLNPTWACSALVMLVTLITLGGHSHYLEKVCLMLGLLEIVFVVAMVAAEPSPVALVEGVKHAGDFQDGSFAYLLAAYVGSTLNPWMMFYEQSAVVDKSLRVEEVPAGRKDTLLGACLCQAVCCAVTITTACKVWGGAYVHGVSHDGFGSLAEVAAALSPYGTDLGVDLVYLGFLGSSMNAMLVVALTAVFTLAEVAGLKEGKKSFLQHPVSEQPALYAAFFAILVVATGVSLQDLDLIGLNLTANILNAVLLPIAMVFLVSLASDPELVPPCLLLSGWERVHVIVILSLISVGSLVTVLL